MKTMICLILDRSGSMNGRENDVVGGVNTFLTDQKQLPDPAVIAFVRFDSEGVERFRPMTNLTDVAPLTAEEYQPRGYTPLLDAIGKTLNDLEADWKREQPDRAIVVIATDGEENASREFTKDRVKAMIWAREASKKWAFIYLGANVDAFAEAGALGISPQNVANYVKSAAGVASMYATVSASVRGMRTTGQMMADNLGGDINEDGTVTKKPDPTIQQGSGTWMPPGVSATPANTVTPTGTVWTPPV